MSDSLFPCKPTLYSPKVFETQLQCYCMHIDALRCNLVSSGVDGHHCQCECRSQKTVEAPTSMTKTSRRASMQGWRLPLAGPLRLVPDMSWAKACLRARRESGLPDEREHDMPMMLAPPPIGGLMRRPLSTCEAAVWLARIVGSKGSGSGRIKSQSLKTTLLPRAASALSTANFLVITFYMVRNPP
eukprot:4926565-Amphidinium_carterae.1